MLSSPRNWNEDATLASGYWFSDDDAAWQPTEPLLEFLTDVPPPIYLGFGSMVAADPQRLTELAVSAVQHSGQRTVLATGWGGLVHNNFPSSDNLLWIEQRHTPGCFRGSER